ncbi:MAG TPA: hypothetical protein DCZ94_10155 [Lentisphaeria bacterium]|nr:MAG: hypothetical protein A2X48_11030 [Lentisphaerae bacterium GWF2_49_21]HBC87306.1 hypothetical protein [Lentisphaeria bacterium]
MIWKKTKRWLGRYVDGNDVKLLHSGEEFFTALETHIRNAKALIHLQIYIFEPDDTGIRIINLLKEAAARGVQVYVVLDAFGSQDFSSVTIQEMDSCGIHIRKFSPFLWMNFSLERKMHHKIFVADEEIALIAGLNISNSYRGSGTEAPWLDFGVQIRGPLCAEMEKACRERWKRQFRKAPLKIPSESGSVRARTSRNDWFRSKVHISATYLDMLRNSSREVLMLAPYFLPGYRFMRLLLKARKRGVRVVLVLPGISDVPLIKHATDHLYSLLLLHGVEIYEWKQTVLHGKAAIVDSSWCTIGSYNPNALSDYLSLEMNIDIDDRSFSAQFREELEREIISKCRKITEVEHSRSGNYLMRLFNTLAYHSTWFLLRLQYMLTSRR